MPDLLKFIWGVCDCNPALAFIINDWAHFLTHGNVEHRGGGSLQRHTCDNVVKSCSHAIDFSITGREWNTTIHYERKKQEVESPHSCSAAMILKPPRPFPLSLVLVPHLFNGRERCSVGGSHDHIACGIKSFRPCLRGRASSKVVSGQTCWFTMRISLSSAADLCFLVRLGMNCSVPKL